MARPSKIDTMTYKELLDLQEQVKAAIAERRAAEQDQLKRKVLALARQSGVDVSELFGARSLRKGKKPGVKYRNPADPTQTWTGRGRKPKWLVEALGKGAKMERFAA